MTVDPGFHPPLTSKEIDAPACKPVVIMCTGGKNTRIGMALFKKKEVNYLKLMYVVLRGVMGHLLVGGGILTFLAGKKKEIKSLSKKCNTTLYNESCLI